MAVRNTLFTSYEQCLRKFLFTMAVLIINIIPAFSKLETLSVFIFLQAISNIDSFIDFCIDQELDKRLKRMCELCVELSIVALSVAAGLLISDYEFDMRVDLIIRLVLITIVGFPMIILWHDKRMLRERSG